MIQLSDKHKCCGCSACVQVCPKQCITFDEDEKGFRYPVVNEKLCVNCGLCEKVCLFLNKNELRIPLSVNAAINPNEEIRMQSSSGGVFSMIAEKVIDDGGVVFGARFDENWEVIHDYADTKDGINAFRGSKYVQSKIGNSYIKAKEFLNDGKKVLFTGTSCQIAGLKCFLNKEYQNLLTVDVVCHGVPSPLVWRDYLKYVLLRPKGVDGKNTVLSVLSPNEMPVITGISFRDKTTGWKKFGFVIREKPDFINGKNSVLSSTHTPKEFVNEYMTENLYMQLFLNNLCIRPSCTLCPSKCGRSGSDITIADFWGISNVMPEIDDDKGVSLVMIYTNSGVRILKDIGISLIPATYDQAIAGNPAIESSWQSNELTPLFWKLYKKYGILAGEKVLAKMRPSAIKVYAHKVKILLMRLVLPNKLK